MAIRVRIADASGPSSRWPRPPSHHVANEERCSTTLEGKHVVEVAARSGTSFGQVADRQLPAGDCGQPGGEDGLLEAERGVPQL